MNYNWNWGILFQPSPEGQGTYLDMLLIGLGWTVATGICAWIVALFSAPSSASPARFLRKPRNASASPMSNSSATSRSWCNSSCGTSSCPSSCRTAWGRWLKQLQYASFYTAVVGIGLYMSARVAEQVRAGINSMARGQRHAALAVGLTLAQSYRYVLLPMAFRIILPPLTSEFLNTIKNTSVALTIGLLELTSRARAMQEFSFQVFEAFTVATVIYLLLEPRRGRRLRAGLSAASPCPAISPARDRRRPFSRALTSR